MTDIDTTDGLGTTEPQGGRKAKAKAAIDQASQTLKTEAQTFAQTAQERARAEAQRRTEAATRTLGDFANAIRKAGEDLAEHDQSPAAQLVRQAADGLESISRNLAGRQPEELLDAVRDFGRRNPAMFIGGAVLVGVALGRFVRASETAAMDAGLADGGAYPVAETSAYATPAYGTADEAAGLAEDEGLAGQPEFSGAAAADVEGPVRDDLGGLQPSDVEDSTSVLGVDEESGPERRGS